MVQIELLGRCGRWFVRLAFILHTTAPYYQQQTANFRTWRASALAWCVILDGIRSSVCTVVLPTPPAAATTPGFYLPLCLSAPPQDEPSRHLPRCITNHTYHMTFHSGYLFLLQTALRRNPSVVTLWHGAAHRYRHHYSDLARAAARIGCANDALLAPHAACAATPARSLCTPTCACAGTSGSLRRRHSRRHYPLKSKAFLPLFLARAAYTLPFTAGSAGGAWRCHTAAHHRAAFTLPRHYGYLHRCTHLWRPRPLRAHWPPLRAAHAFSTAAPAHTAPYIHVRGATCARYTRCTRARYPHLPSAGSAPSSATRVLATFCAPSRLPTLPHGTPAGSSSRRYNVLPHIPPLPPHPPVPHPSTTPFTTPPAAVARCHAGRVHDIQHMPLTAAGVLYYYATYITA